MAAITGIILAMALIILCPKCGGTRLMKVNDKLYCPKCRYTLTEEDKEKGR
jgi:uncharacterized Zn finger protein (UPF0148 family)